MSNNNIYNAICKFISNKADSLYLSSKFNGTTSFQNPFILEELRKDSSPISKEKKTILFLTYFFASLSFREHFLLRKEDFLLFLIENNEFINDEQTHELTNLVDNLYYLLQNEAASQEKIARLLTDQKINLLLDTIIDNSSFSLWVNFNNQYTSACLQEQVKIIDVSIEYMEEQNNFLTSLSNSQNLPFEKIDEYQKLIEKNKNAIKKIKKQRDEIKQQIGKEFNSDNAFDLDVYQDNLKKAIALNNECEVISRECYDDICQSNPELQIEANNLKKAHAQKKKAIKEKYDPIKTHLKKEILFFADKIKEESNSLNTSSELLKQIADTSVDLTSTEKHQILELAHELEQYSKAFEEPYDSQDIKSKATQLTKKLDSLLENDQVTDPRINKSLLKLKGHLQSLNSEPKVFIPPNKRRKKPSSLNPETIKRINKEPPSNKNAPEHFKQCKQQYSIINPELINISDKSCDKVMRIIVKINDAPNSLPTEKVQELKLLTEYISKTVEESSQVSLEHIEKLKEFTNNEPQIELSSKSLKKVFRDIEKAIENDRDEPKELPLTSNRC